MAEEQLPEVVQQLVAWRKRNKLSQRAAVEAMRARNFPVTLTSLGKWEAGERRPGKFAAQVLAAFLKKHPSIPKPTD
jgi:DNA-binding transcriptional regulator YiaG